MPNFTLAKTKKHHLFSTMNKAHAPQIHPNYTNTPHHHHTSSSVATADDEEVAATTQDIATAYASRRFFMANPGKSNSITDSEAAEVVVVAAEVGGCVVVQTYSPDPYMDFRRSMQEMVEACDVHTPKEALDYLQELLVTYLSLNPKSTHKYILRAFAGLFVSLLSPTSSISSSS